MSTRALLIASLILAMSVSASGQYPKHHRQQAAQATPTPINIDGIVESVGSGWIRISSAQNQPMMILIGPESEVHVIGDAAPAYIQRGKCVEFTAHVEKGGAVKEKVTQLSVVTPTVEKPCGLSAAGSGGGSSGDAGGFDFAAPTTTTKAAPAKEHKKPKVVAVKLPADCLVRGHVKSCKAGALTINCGRTLVRAELGDNPEIKVDAADLAAVSKGDKIAGSGFSQGGKVGAEKVTITAHETIGGGEGAKKSAHPDKKASKAAEKTDKADKAGS